MGFFDTLVEGLSSVVHVVATVANDASSIATTMGKIGLLSEEQVTPLQPDDAPVIEALRANCQLADNYLQTLAKTTLSPTTGADGIALTNIQSTIGMVRKMRVISLNSLAAGGGATDVTQATGLMYNDLASIISQLGAPAMGLYNGTAPLLDNAAHAADQLFLNAVEVDPTNPTVTTSSIVLNDETGSPKYKIAHAGYNLRLDQTGRNDVSHSCFAYGEDANNSSAQRAQERMARRKAGADVIARPLSTPEASVQGFALVVAVGVRIMAEAIPFAQQLQIFATAEDWSVPTVVVTGAIITLNILTATSPMVVQCDIIDWVAGRLNSTTIQPPTPKPDLTEVVIVSSVPELVTPPSLRSK